MKVYDILVALNLFSFVGGPCAFMFGIYLITEALDRDTHPKLKQVFENLGHPGVERLVVFVVVLVIVQLFSPALSWLFDLARANLPWLNRAFGTALNALKPWLLVFTQKAPLFFWLRLFTLSTLLALAAFGSLLVFWASKRKNSSALLFAASFLLVLAFESSASSGNALAALGVVGELGDSDWGRLANVLAPFWDAYSMVF